MLLSKAAYNGFKVIKTLTLLMPRSTVVHSLYQRYMYTCTVLTLLASQEKRSISAKYSLLCRPLNFSPHFKEALTTCGGVAYRVRSIMLRIMN